MKRVQNRYVPDVNSLWLAAGGALIAMLMLIPVVPGYSGWLWLAVSGVVLIIDGWRLTVTPVPRLQRELDDKLPVMVWRTAHLQLENRAHRTLVIQLYDWLPASFDSTTMPLTTTLAAGETQSLSYALRARRRGDFTLTSCDLVLQSPWRCWRRRCRLRLADAVKVYPNYAELGLYLSLAQKQRLDQLGIHQHPMRGLGSDFYQLREYRAGDSLRHVAWKAVASYQRLITREFRDDRDQQVLLLLDTGRRMRHADQQRGHLDDALDAMLLLAFVALRQGDAVGMLTFGGEQRWFAPRKGPQAINHLLNAVYDIQAQPVASDYLNAAQQVLSRQQRRSLVVLLTNSRDEDYQPLLDAAYLLRRRHLVIIADLREVMLQQTLQQPPQQFTEALDYFAYADYVAARSSAHQLLTQRGVHLLDVAPQQLAAALVNQYQQLKRSGQLAT